MPAAIDTSREDPLVGFLFGFEVQGAIKGYFTEASGMGSETEVVEQKVVSEKGVQVVLKVPGRLKWNDLTLKRGLTSSMDMWVWRKLVEDGKIKDARKNATVTMFDQELKAVAQWTLENCWPSKLTGPTAKSDANEFGMEELVVVAESYKRTQ